MQALVQAAVPFDGVSRAAVRGLEVPTLVLRGARASPLHAWVCAELLRLTPRARAAVIDNAGHGSPAENPEAFNAAVEAFLGPQARR